MYKPKLRGEPNYKGVYAKTATAESLFDLAMSGCKPKDNYEYRKLVWFISAVPVETLDRCEAMGVNKIFSWLKWYDLRLLLQRIIHMRVREVTGEILTPGRRMEQLRMDEYIAVRNELDCSLRRLRKLEQEHPEPDKMELEMKKQQKTIKALERRLSTEQRRYDRLYDSVAASRMLRINALKAEISRLERELEKAGGAA